MRYSKKFWVLTLMLAACAIPCAAQTVPPGSYQQTCTDISVNGSTLTARCQDTGGGWRSTQLNDYRDCNTEIVNDNGSLRCSRGGYGQGGGYGYGQGGYPPGDYVQTCRNIHTSGNRLDAECQKRDGGWRHTSLDNVNQCSSPIANDNGNLVCGRGGYGSGGRGSWQNGLPPGDYVQTCRNTRVDGNKLKAECQKRDGGWRKTSLKNVDRCSSPIANDDGHLVCGRGGYGSPGDYHSGWQNGLPPGDYVQTCRNIQVNGTRLDAECKARDGDWRRTSLYDIDRCSSPIANDDGHLVCGK